MRRLQVVSLGDQFMSNASNALMVLAIAGSSTSPQFGAFTVVYAALAFAVGLERSLLATPISLVAGDKMHLKDESAQAMGLLALCSPVLALALLLVGLSSEPRWAPLLVIAAITPVVLLQDLLRFAAVAHGRPWAAFWSDLLWAMFALAAFIGQLTLGIGAGFVSLVWACGALVALLVLGFALGVPPRFEGLRPWLRGSRPLRYRLTAGTAAMSASVPLSLALFSSLGGTTAVAALGGAGQLMAPVNTLTAFVGLTLLARIAGRSRAVRSRQCRIAGVGLALTSMLWAGLLLAIPDKLGSLLLGATWPATQSILSVVGVQYALSGLAYAGTLFLTSDDNAKAVMVTGVVVAFARLVFVAVAAQAGTGPWYLVVAETLTMVLWLLVTLTRVRKW